MKNFQNPLQSRSGCDKMRLYDERLGESEACAPLFFSDYLEEEARAWLR